MSLQLLKEPFFWNLIKCLCKVQTHYISMDALVSIFRNLVQKLKKVSDAGLLRHGAILTWINQLISLVSAQSFVP